MPDLLLELFSEEIPARMQVQAAKDLERLVVGALSDRLRTLHDALLELVASLEVILDFPDEVIGVGVDAASKSARPFSAVASVGDPCTPVRLNDDHHGIRCSEPSAQSNHACSPAG